MILGGELACWLIVNVCPPPPSGVIVMTAIRAVFTVFAAAVQLTDPGPIPEAPDIMVIHELVVVAVH